MAYLNNINEQQQQALSQSGFLLGGGSENAIAGLGGTQTGSQGNRPTTAGKAGQWTNVQDILRANPGGGAMKGQIEKSGQEFIQSGQDKLQQAQATSQGDLSGVAPSAYSGQDVFQSPDLENVRQGLTQQYQAQDYADVYNPGQAAMAQQESLQDPTNKLGSLTSFNQYAMQPSAKYNPRMQALDKLLLSGDQDFVQNYGGQLAGQYQSQVLDPMAAAQAEAVSQSQDLAQNVAGERQKWSSGLTDFLTGQGSQVDQAMAAMQAESSSNLGKLDERDERKDYIQNLYSPDQWNEVAPYFSYNALDNLFSQTGQDPTRSQATQRALGQEGIGRYNELAALLSETGGNKFDELRGEAGYAPKSWDFNKSAFEAGISQTKKEKEAAAAKKAAAKRAAAKKAYKPSTYSNPAAKVSTANTNQGAFGPNVLESVKSGVKKHFGI